MANEPVAIKSLERFSLAFEFDKTWHEARSAVKARSADSK